MNKHLEMNRHNGTNIFGQTCIAESVTIHPETALQQYLAAVTDVKAHIGDRMEYTLDFSEMTPAQFMEFQEDLGKLMQIRSSLSYHPGKPHAA